MAAGAVAAAPLRGDPVAAVDHLRVMAAVQVVTVVQPMPHKVAAAVRVATLAQVAKVFLLIRAVLVQALAVQVAVATKQVVAALDCKAKAPVVLR